MGDQVAELMMTALRRLPKEEAKARCRQQPPTTYQNILDAEDAGFEWWLWPARVSDLTSEECSRARALWYRHRAANAIRRAELLEGWADNPDAFDAFINDKLGAIAPVWQYDSSGQACLIELPPQTVPDEKHKREHIPRGLRFRVLMRDGRKCCNCGRHPPEVKLEIDHIVPVAKGGKSVAENLQVLCRDCNRGKGAQVLH